MLVLDTNVYLDAGRDAGFAERLAAFVAGAARPREALGDRDARTLARELLGMSQGEFSALRGCTAGRARTRVTHQASN